jgi:polyphosphate kinase 2 (PPK2 family)
MPIPKPKKEEKKQDYLERCIRFLVNEGRAVDQASTICYRNWRKKK